MGKGLDVGTNMLVCGFTGEDGIPKFKMERDAFYRIVPKSDVNKNAISNSLQKRGSNFIVDGDDFIVVGEDALQIAIERNDVASRPMRRGVISPREKSNLPMLKLLISNLIGKGEGDESLIYSVPAKPIDGMFDIVYHTEILNMFFREQGYNSQPINEAFAIALSELLDDALTGIAISFGAGMCNIAVIHQGDPLVEFSITRSGDFIDQSVANALDLSSSLVQLEKEAGVDLFNPKNKIMEAVSVYYSSVITYVLDNIAYELRKRERDLPLFREPVPIVVSGGLALADGFVKLLNERIKGVELPMEIKEIRRASSPMTCVANGCYLASQL